MKKQANNTSLSVIYWVKIGGMTTRMYRTYMCDKIEAYCLFHFSYQTKYLLWWLKLFLLPNLSCNTVKISPTLNSQPTSTITSLLNKLQLLKRLQCLTGNTTCTSAEMWWTYTISLTSCNDNVHIVSFLTSIQYLIQGKVCKATHSLHTPFLQILLLLFKHTTLFCLPLYQTIFSLTNFSDLQYI